MSFNYKVVSWDGLQIFKRLRKCKINTKLLVMVVLPVADVCIPFNLLFIFVFCVSLFFVVPLSSLRLWYIAIYCIQDTLSSHARLA